MNQLKKSQFLPFLLLIFGLLCIGWSAIFVKLAAVSGFASAFYRMDIGAGALVKNGADGIIIIKDIGGEPFDADLTVRLDEINFEDENSILRMWQTVNSEQLTNATYDYLLNMSKNMGSTPPKRENIKPIQNETRTASRVHGPYSKTTQPF